MEPGSRATPWGVKSRLGQCPSCGHPRCVDNQRGLLDAERAWYYREFALHPSPTNPFHPLQDGMRKLAIRGSDRWFWACDSCLRSGRALAANVVRQNLALGTPFAAYVDRPFVCEDCLKPSVFDAGEQRHWFETLGFLIWVYPKQCAECRAVRRRRKRSHQALAEALHRLDPTDPVQLEAIARLYAELGSAKAAEFRARLKNAGRRPKRHAP